VQIFARVKKSGASIVHKNEGFRLSKHLRILYNKYIQKKLKGASPIMMQGFDKQEGLLFYLSADQSLTADFAKGQAAPNFAREIEVIEKGGACGG